MIDALSGSAVGPRWVLFVEQHEPGWADCDFKYELVRVLGGDSDLAKVVYGLFGPEALGWLHHPLPALGGRTPRFCAATDEGAADLRRLLSFPN